jgi:hypothetical protein
VHCRLLRYMRVPRHPVACAVIPVVGVCVQLCCLIPARCLQSLCALSGWLAAGMSANLGTCSNRSWERTTCSGHGCQQQPCGPPALHVFVPPGGHPVVSMFLGTVNRHGMVVLHPTVLQPCSTSIYRSYYCLHLWPLWVFLDALYPSVPFQAVRT